MALDLAHQLACVEAGQQHRRRAEQRLTVGLVANALTGLSGVCSYQMQSISLRLIAFLEAFWTRVYSTTLTSWGSGWVSRDFLNL
jgi:hypothetical protein